MMNNNSNDIAKNDKIAAGLPNDKASNLNNMDAPQPIFKSLPCRVKRGSRHTTTRNMASQRGGRWIWDKGEWQNGGMKAGKWLDSHWLICLPLFYGKKKIRVSLSIFETPVQKIRIQVEDAPLLINDVGIVSEGHTAG